MILASKLKKIISSLKDRTLFGYYLSLKEEQYVDKQLKFLTKHLNRAKKNVPFYNRLLADTTITKYNCVEVLKTLPIINKHQIRKDVKDFYANFVDSNWRAWHNTGGSTGEPFYFPIGGGNRWEVNLELLCQAKLYIYIYGSYDVAISSVDGRRVSDKELSRNIYWGKNDSMFPYGVTHYSTMYLNKDTFPFYLANLNKEKPKILRGYPSGLSQIAKLIKETDSKLDFKIEGIYLTSENILDDQVKIIEEVFGCPVWGQYGHSEASVFAIRKPNSEKYECIPLYGYTEILDKNGNHVKEGEVGEIIVTGFSYSAMPFIRYKTGDLAEYGGTRNGIVVLNKLIGRSNDFVVDKDGETKYLVGFIFGGHLKAFNDIENWQIIQEEKGKLHIKIVKGNSYSDSTELELFEFFKTNKFDVQISYCREIEKTKRGKQPFMIQKLNL